MRPRSLFSRRRRIPTYSHIDRDWKYVEYILFILSPVVFLAKSILWTVRGGTNEDGPNVSTGNKVAFVVTSSCILLPILATLATLLFATNDLYAIRLIPVYFFLLVIPCVLCICNVARVARLQNDEDGGGEILSLLLFGCCNCFVTTMLVMAVVFATLKLDGTLSWAWAEILIPLWVVNAIFDCVALSMSIYFAIGIFSGAQIEYKGWLASVLVLMNMTAVSLQIVEALLCIPSLSTLAIVAPLLVSWSILLLIAAMDMSIDAYDACEDMRMEWNQRRAFREKTEHERALHRVESRDDAPFGTATAAVSTHIEVREEHETIDVESVHVDVASKVNDDDLDTDKHDDRFQRASSEIRSANDTAALVRALETIADMIIKHEGEDGDDLSSPRAMWANRARLIDVSREKRRACPDIWTHEVASRLGSILHALSPVRPLLNITSAGSQTDL